MSVVIDATFRGVRVEIAMHFQRGWILVIIWVVAAIGLEPLQFRGVMPCLGLVTAGLGFGQFLTVLGNVGFDRIQSELSNSTPSNFVAASLTTPIRGQNECPQMGGDEIPHGSAQ